MSSCPKRTCENGLTYDRIEQACSAEFCVEGCNPKPCPEGQIYNNGKEFKCIPEIECVVPCMELNGKIYNEGDRITDTQIVDACQTWYVKSFFLYFTNYNLFPVFNIKPTAGVKYV